LIIGVSEGRVVKEPKPRIEGWGRSELSFVIYEALAPRLRSRGVLATQAEVDMLVFFATSYALRTTALVLVKRFGTLVQTEEGFRENPVLDGVVDGNTSALAAEASLGLTEEDLMAADEAAAPFLEQVRAHYVAEGIDLDVSDL
jgi:hypothetical protein